MDTIELDWVPREGMKFSTLDDAWDFWKNYGRRVGFNVRKHYANKSKKDNVITSTRFLCSKEGYRGVDKRDHLVIEHRSETRTGCPVRMGIMLSRITGQFCVHEFVSEHNHILHFAECAHMMVSQRKIADVQAIEVQLADDSGLKQKNTFEFLGRQSGGRANLGFLQLDQKNYLRSKRQREMAYGEVGCLLRYFQNKTLEDPSFFYAVQLDNTEQVTNIFWADARMRIDYELFGDVITFDTTFSTNKEYRPFGVFVGFNQYRGLTIFGAALLYDETSESFIWLFNTFLESHSLKRPKTIFTDQDAAMAKAISEVIPETKHGLCTWHIMQNGIKHIGNLMKEGSYLLSEFKKAMFEYEDEQTFEDSWKEMLSSYSMEENNWLKSIYKLKEKWAKCYMKSSMTLGMRSTQLSESLNGDLKDYLKSNFDLNNFFKHFERVVSDKRYKELQAEYDAREKLPKLKVKTLPLLIQAGKIYCPLIFERFQVEWEKSLTCFIKEQKELNGMNEFLVASYNETHEYTCISNIVEQTISCQCMKFETFGILCSHALKVLDVINVKLIPNKYLLKRWTRGARDEILEKAEIYIQGSIKLDMVDRYRELCPKLIKIASKASHSQERYTYLLEEIEKINKHYEDSQESDSNVAQINSGSMTCAFGSNSLMENRLANASGLKKKSEVKRGKRLKSWVEKQPQRKKKSKKDLFRQDEEVDLSLSQTWYRFQHDPIGAEEINFLKL